jgi:excisionase family DNA binding protein
VTAKYNSEELLNTAEAARFLRVSQASIRRWSDAGLLPGHRVGRRRERRFSHADLLAFMDRSIVPAAGAPAVVVAGLSVPVPAHLATLFSSDSGGLRLTAPFLADGVRLRQPCFLVASADVVRRYSAAMDLDGVEVVHFSGGAAAGAIEQWEDSFARVLASGASVIRVVGEMSEERAMFSSEDEMLRYEETFDLMSKRYPVAVICQYDVRSFDGMALLRALKAHPDLFQYRLGTFLN